MHTVAKDYTEPTAQILACKTSCAVLKIMSTMSSHRECRTPSALHRKMASYARVDA